MHWLAPGDSSHNQRNVTDMAQRYLIWSDLIWLVSGSGSWNSNTASSKIHIWTLSWARTIASPVCFPKIYLIISYNPMAASFECTALSKMKPDARHNTTENFGLITGNKMHIISYLTLLFLCTWSCLVCLHIHYSKIICQLSSLPTVANGTFASSE
jgi:hypothetical protein